MIASAAHLAARVARPSFILPRHVHTLAFNAGLRPCQARAVLRAQRQLYPGKRWNSSSPESITPTKSDLKAHFGEERETLEFPWLVIGSSDNHFHHQDHASLSH